MSDDRLRALEAKVAQLTAEVTELKRTRAGMGASLRCPACGGVRILWFKRIQLPTLADALDNRLGLCVTAFDLSPQP